MSPWHLARNLSLLLVSCGMTPGLASAAPSAAPESAAPWQADAEFLNRQGKEAFVAGDFEKAVFYLQRLVKKYPAAVGYADAHYFLGQALLKLEKAEKAEPNLKYFIEAAGTIPEAIDARLLLGDAYLNQKKNSEAFLLSKEIERFKLDPLHHARMLLLKARSLIALNRNDDAEATLRSAIKDLQQIKPSPSSILASAYFLKFQLKLAHCSLYAGRSPLSEAQTIAEMEQRGDCLLESLLIYRELLAHNHQREAKKASQEIVKEFSRYRSRCESPPDSPERLNAGQKSQYKLELSQRLMKTCSSKARRALSIFRSWTDAASSREEGLKAGQKEALHREAVSQVESVSKSLGETVQHENQ